MKYEEIIQIYKDYEMLIIKAFEKKQGYEFTGYLANGTWISFSDYYSFTIDDIIQDLQTKQKKGFIFKWFDETIENYDYQRISYNSYIMGLRFNKNISK